MGEGVRGGWDIDDLKTSGDSDDEENDPRFVGVVSLPTPPPTAGRVIERTSLTGERSETA